MTMETPPPRISMLERYGGDVSEPERTKDNPFCCGAGGGLLFEEHEAGTRISQARFEQLQATGANTIVMGCPFCSIMLKGAGSVDVSARPVLPKTDATSGNDFRMRSWTWRSRVASVTEMPGSVVGMERMAPSSSGGMNSEPRRMNTGTVSRAAAATQMRCGRRARCGRQSRSAQK